MEWLLDTPCLVCSKRLTDGRVICVSCSFGLARPELVSESNAPPGLDLVVGATRYEGASRRIIADLKRRGNLAIAEWLGMRLWKEWLLAEAAVGQGSWSRFVVTWVPGSAEGWRTRGFVPAELLAQAFAKQSGVSAVPMLNRVDRENQTQRSLRERLQGPQLELLATDRMCSARVLLVDDVLTTGTTVSAAALLLRRGGARVVHAAIGAITPGHPLSDE